MRWYWAKPQWPKSHLLLLCPIKLIQEGRIMRQVSWLLDSPLRSIFSKAKQKPWLANSVLLGSILLAVCCFLVFSPASIQADSPLEVVPVDSFETYQAWISLTQSDVAASTASGPGILGGERDLEITREGTSGPTLEAGISNGAFYYGQGFGLSGSVRIEWDGSDGNPSNLDPAGLGGLDLTAGGRQDALSLQVSVDDLPANPQIEVFSNADQSSTFVLSLPGTIYSPVEYVIPFEAFTTHLGEGAIFSDVGAITLVVNASTPLDMVIDSFAIIPLLRATNTDALVVDNDGDGQAGPGDTLQYTVLLANPADAFEAAATGVIFSDTPDLNTTLVISSVTTTQGTVTSGNQADDTEVAVDIGPIEDGGSVMITFEVTINESLSGDAIEVVNQGLVSSDTLTNLPTDDPDTETAADPTTTPVVTPAAPPAPAITATKTDSLPDDSSAGQASPGDVLTYTVVIANNGSEAVSGVVFSDTLDLNTTLVVSSVTTTQGTITSGNNPDDTGVVVDIGPMTAGDRVTIVFEATINESVSEDVTEVANQGVVSGTNLANVLTDDPETDAAVDPTVTFTVSP
jgi:uncharacterized repeat protein (TIGR01451 family)